MAPEGHSPVNDHGKLVVGDKVELIKEAGRFYKTMIEDDHGGGAYLVGVPSYGGIPMLLHINDEVLAVFYRESGRYVSPMRVLKLTKEGEVRYALLIQKSKPRRHQRREAFRLPVSLRAAICEYSEGIEEELLADAETPETAALEAALCLDISVTGISFTTKRQYAPGDCCLLRLYMGYRQNAMAPFDICAEVMRSSPGLKRGTYYTGFRFFGQSKRMNDHLSRYVFTEQQKQIKQRRHVESST